ncbi:hypothetical protein D3C81_996740 [compost metagenome]
MLARDLGAVVPDDQLGVVLVQRVRQQPDRARQPAAVTPGVVEQVAQHLLQLRGVEHHRLGHVHGQADGVGVDVGTAGRAGLAGARAARAHFQAPALDDLGQRLRQVHGAAAGARAARHLQHVGHHLVEPAHVVMDDAQQARVDIDIGTTAVRRAGLLPRGIGQQLAGLADGRQRVADLVRDAGHQPAHRGQLFLLHLFGNALPAFDMDQHGVAHLAAQQRFVFLRPGHGLVLRDGQAQAGGGLGREFVPGGGIELRRHRAPVRQRRAQTRQPRQHEAQPQPGVLHGAVGQRGA